MIPSRKFDGQRVVVVGTGPSLTTEVMEMVEDSLLPVFGMNNVYQYMFVDVLMSCNVEWWRHYWPQDRYLREGTFDKWTWDAQVAEDYGINHIEGVWGEGLSKVPGVIHYGHSSSYQTIGLAHQYGASEILLVGFDMRYPPDYDRATRSAGGQRHFWPGGEYPPSLQHWPMVGPNGEMAGLIECFRTIRPSDYGLRIINCTPDSALDCFERGELEHYL